MKNIYTNKLKKIATLFLLSITILLFQNCGYFEVANITDEQSLIELPRNTTLPAISGSTMQGQVLTGTMGVWTDNPTNYAGQWQRNSVAIIGATTTSYTLQANDVGSRISFAVSATNATGTTVATSVESDTVVAAAGPDYFVVALQGQSGVKYAATSEGAPGPFNRDGMLRPTITGSLGHYVDKYGDKPNYTTVSIANGGLVDLEINDFNFHNRTNKKIVPRGAYAVASFMKFMAPTKTPVFITLSKVGTAMDQMMDNNDNERSWVNMQNTIDYVKATYGPLDLYVHSWYGSEPAGNYQASRSVHWMGELWNGTKHNLGLTANNLTPGGGNGRAVNRYIFDVNPTGAYQGILPYNDGKLKIAFVNHNDPVDRANREAFFADPRLSSMSVGTHTVPMTGHIDDALEDAPLIALMTMAPPILKVLGYTTPYPKVLGYTAATNGSYVDVTVSLPNGGNLTTIRAQRGIPDPVSPDPVYLPAYGFEVAAPGVAEADRASLKRSEWSAEIINSGTGTGPNRTGTVRLTPTTPIANGTKLTYRMGGTTGGREPPMDQMSFFNRLIEEVPAFQQPGVEWPFPGFEVRYSETMTAVSVGVN